MNAQENLQNNFPDKKDQDLESFYEGVRTFFIWLVLFNVILGVVCTILFQNPVILLFFWLTQIFFAAPLAVKAQVDGKSEFAKGMIFSSGILFLLGIGSCALITFVILANWRG